MPEFNGTNWVKENITPYLIVVRGALKGIRDTATLLTDRVTDNEDAITVLDDLLVDTSTNNALVRYDQTEGKQQDSIATLLDNGKLTYYTNDNKPLNNGEYGKTTYEKSNGDPALIVGAKHSSNGSSTLQIPEGLTILGNTLVVEDDFVTQAQLQFDMPSKGNGKFLRSDASGNATWQDGFDLPNHGIKTSNFVMPVGGGRVTIDCSGGVRSASLPTATGSGDVYIVSFINCNYDSYGSLVFNSSNTLNQVDYNARFVQDHSMVIVDSAPLKYTTSGVLNVRNVTLHVPSQFATIQEALDAAPGFHSAAGIIWVQVANGITHLTGAECNLRCYHTQRVVVRGTSAQYYPRWDNGLDTTFSAHDVVANRAICMAFGGTKLLVNSTNNGINLASASCVSFCYMQIHDNKNGTPDITPSNYILSDTLGAPIYKQFDRVLFFGSKYGMQIKYANYIYWTYITMLHQSSRACYFDRCGMISMYRFVSMWTLYGFYFHNTKANLSRCQAKCRGGTLSGTGRALFAVNSQVTLTYPQLEGRNEAVHVTNDAYVSISMTPNTLDFNKTVLIADRIVHASNSEFLFTSGGASANCNIVGSSTYLLDSVRSKINLGSNIANSDTPIPANKVLRVRDGSIGYGGHLTGLTLSPLHQVDGNNFSRWI